MGILCDYFIAGSDEKAATAAEMLGGPAPKLGSEGRFGITNPRSGFDAVALKGVDPFVKIGRLEALLTQRPFDEVATDARTGTLVASAGDEEILVVSVTDSLRDALAGATDADLSRMLPAWMQTEEFVLDGAWNMNELEIALHELAALARRAHAYGARLYCWMSV